jgi:hypothetical protein
MVLLGAWIRRAMVERPPVAVVKAPAVENS